MGHITSLHGFIQEFPDWKNKYRTHNNRVLEKLPNTSEYPPLNKGMFHVPKGIEQAEQIAYWGRMIVFGGSFKGMDAFWEEWLEKFEKLLCRLIWTEAQVHIITEWYPEEVCKWKTSIDYSKRLLEKSPELIPVRPEDWAFKGIRTFENY